MGFKSEMSGIEEAHLGLRYVAFECLSTRRQKERIVLSPCSQQRWPMCAEVGLKLRIQCDVAFIVAEQVKLHFGDARSTQVKIVERVAVGRYRSRIRYAVRVLPD